MPSGLVTCAWLPAQPTQSAGLYCMARYILTFQYDHMGVVYLPPVGSARYTGAGNDILLNIGGYRSDGSGSDPRPTLAYGRSWSRAGFTCMSRSTGVDCRRGAHGLHLSRGSIRLF